MKDLLVGTILARDDEAQRKWLGLQLRWLAATTESFDHVTVVMNGSINEPNPLTRFIIPSDTTKQYHEAHLLGLRTLRTLFGQELNNYRNFLILDSDAFPIKVGWLGKLLNVMGTDDVVFEDGAAMTSLKKKQHQVALALRSENLERRLHASILFIRKEWLHQVSFDVAEVGKDLLGVRECDIHLPYYETEKGRTEAFPLIRTNKENVHPLSCGIYYDMFYHHACGSGRKYNLRSTKYWGEFASEVMEGDYLDQLAEGLFRNPGPFVWTLAGWKPDEYPDEV